MMYVIIQYNMDAVEMIQGFSTTKATRLLEFVLTRGEIVSCRKSQRFKFTISKKFNPQESATGLYFRWVLLSTETTNDWRKAKRSISHFNMIKFTLPRRLYGIFFIEV